MRGITLTPALSHPGRGGMTTMGGGFEGFGTIKTL